MESKIDSGLLGAWEGSPTLELLHFQFYYPVVNKFRGGGVSNHSGLSRHSQLFSNTRRILEAQMSGPRGASTARRTILRFDLASISINDKPNVYKNPQLVLKPQLQLPPRTPFTGSQPRMPIWHHWLMVHVKDKADELVGHDFADSLCHADACTDAISPGEARSRYLQAVLGGCKLKIAPLYHMFVLEAFSNFPLSKRDRQSQYSEIELDSLTIRLTHLIHSGCFHSRHHVAENIRF